MSAAGQQQSRFQSHWNSRRWKQELMRLVRNERFVKELISKVHSILTTLAASSGVSVAALAKIGLLVRLVCYTLRVLNGELTFAESVVHLAAEGVLVDVSVLLMEVLIDVMKRLAELFLTVYYKHVRPLLRGRGQVAAVVRVQRPPPSAAPSHGPPPQWLNCVFDYCLRLESVVRYLDSQVSVGSVRENGRETDVVAACLKSSPTPGRLSGTSSKDYALVATEVVKLAVMAANFVRQIKARTKTAGGAALDRHQNNSDTSIAATTKKRNRKALLYCPLCLNDEHEPCALSCGHVFCCKCCIQQLKSSATCPVCQSPFDRQKIMSLFNL